MSSVKQDLLSIIRQTANLVQDLRTSGEEVSLFYSAQQPAAPPSQTAPPARPRAGLSAPGKKITAPSGEMGALAGEIESCVACALHRDRTQTVLGEGSLEAPVVFIGEAPRAEEEREGRPFRGPAGELLDKIMAAIGLDRSQVYLCNLLKCRLPANRNPTPACIWNGSWLCSVPG